MSIKENLQQQVENWKRIGAPPGAWLMQEFVLRNGQTYEGRNLPSSYIPGVPKYCFSNAQEYVAGNGSLRYVEGFAMRDDIEFTMHHAWCIDARNRVVDPTMIHAEHCSYMGVIFMREQIRAARGIHSISVLDGDHGINWKLIAQLDPYLKEQVERFL